MAQREVKYVLNAEDRTRAAFDSVRGSLGGITDKAALAAGTLAGLGGAATIGGMIALARSIADSLDAMNDLRDATGASIENISALDDVARRTGTSVDTVGTSLVKFNAALIKTREDGSAAGEVLKALGLNAKQLRDIDPAEAMRQTAVALQGFADDGNKARAVQELFGKSLREVAPFLKDLAEAGALHATVTKEQAEEAEKFNKQLFRMQANATDLKRQIASELLPTMNDLMQSILGTGDASNSMAATLGGGLKIALQTIGVMGHEVAFVLQGVGREIGAIAAQMRALDLTPLDMATPGALAAKLTRSVAGGAMTQYNAIGQAVREDGQRARATRDAAIARIMGTAGSGAVIDPYAALEERRLSQDRRSSIGDIPAAAALAKATKQNTEAEKEWALFIAFRRKAFLDAYDAQIKAQAEWDKAYAESMRMQQDMDREALVAIEQRVLGINTELANYGRLQSEIEATKLARMEESREGAYLAGEDVEGINARIDAQRRLVDALKRKEGLDAQREAAADAARAWDQVGQSFVDSLMRGGKSVAQYLKDLFRTLVLRPILAPVGSAMAGLLGMPGTANAGGLLGGLLGGLGNLSSLGNLTNLAGFGNGSSIFTQFATSGLGEALGLSTTVDAIGGLGTASTSLSSMGSMFATAGPWVAAAAAIYALSQQFKGETRSGGQYNFGNLISGPSGGEIGVGSTSAGNAAAATAASINATLAALGSSSRLSNFMTGLETSEKGKGFAYAGGTLSTGGVFGQGWGAAFSQDPAANRRGSMTAEQAVAAFSEELKQATLQAIQAATDVPEAVMRLVRDHDFDTMAAAQLDTTLASIQSVITGVDQFRAAVALLPFAQLKTASFDLAAALADASGGMEKFLGNLSAYYSNFFTEEEQRLQVATNIRNALAGAGADFTVDQILGATRGQFRQVVEAFQNRTDADGVKLYTTLLAVADAFAAIHPEAATLSEALDDSGAAMADYVDQLEQQARGLMDTISTMQGYADSLKRFRMDLALGPLAQLSPEARYNASKAEFQRLAALAPGNAERMAGLEGAGRTFLEASGAYNATSMAYFTDLAAVRGAVEASEFAATTQLQLSQMQLGVLQAQLAALQGIQANTAATAAGVTGGAAPSVPNYSGSGIASFGPGSATAYGAAGSSSFGPGSVVPGYASGGIASGYAWVGERGPELAYFPGSARIYSAGESAAMVAGGDAGLRELSAKVDALVRVVAEYAARDLANGAQLVAGAAEAGNQRLLASVGA